VNGVSGIYGSAGDDRILDDGEICRPLSDLNSGVLLPVAGMNG